MKKFFLLAVLAIIMHPGIDAQVNFLTASDKLTSSIPFQGTYSAIDVSHEGLLYALAGDTVYTINHENGTILERLSVTDTSYSAFPAFITLDPNNGDIWVGYTTFENADDRIYKYDVSDESWSHIASFPGNFDLAFLDDEVLVSGLNSSNFNDPNGIWLLDHSGNNEHRLLIATGGYSAGLDTDPDGNVYYASSFFNENALLKWDHEDVFNLLASGSDTLRNSDATTLTTLPAGSYDIDLDTANNIIFNCNNFVLNFLGMWDGIDSYDTLATSDLFLTRLSTKGNLSLEGITNQALAMAYGTDIAEVHFDITQGLQTPSFSESIKVYPNPAFDYIRISTADMDKAELFIIDMQGRTILRKELSSVDENINISKLDPGSYLLVLNRNGQAYNTMILKR